MSDRRACSIQAVLGAVLATTTVGACDGVSYVARQGWGQAKVLAGRERISAVLARPDLDPARRRKLQLVLLARRYAHEEIGLRLTGAYTFYHDTGGRPVAYNLSAAPKDALQPKRWTFPIVGSVPYLGFFERQEALVEQARLERQGLDTLVRPVAAYSSLGWFDDPISSLLLDRDPWQIVDLVLHEMTHTTVFLRHQVAFNESLAVFVAQQGTLNLIARLLGPRSAAAQRVGQGNVRRERFALLIAEVQQRLTRLYRSPLPRAEKLRRRELEFARAQQRYREIFPDPDSWGAFVRRPLNNAVLLSHGRYHGGLGFHRRVYRCLGRDLSRLVALYSEAQGFDDPIGRIARVCGLPRPGGSQI